MIPVTKKKQAGPRDRLSVEMRGLLLELRKFLVPQADNQLGEERPVVITRETRTLQPRNDHDIGTHLEPIVDLFCQFELTYTSKNHHFFHRTPFCVLMVIEYITDDAISQDTHINKTLHARWSVLLVRRVGLEPTATGLKGPCSTTELPALEKLPKFGNPIVAQFLSLTKLKSADVIARI